MDSVIKLSIILGAAIGSYLTEKNIRAYMSEDENEYCKNSFGTNDTELVKELFGHQYVVEHLTGGDIKRWFQKNGNADFEKGLTRIGPQLLSRINQLCNVEMDGEHYLLQYILNERGEISEYRMINFITIEEKLKILLDDNDGKITIKG